MEAERWKRIDDLLQAALERPPGERVEFLRLAGAGDEALEREVRSLVASEEAAGGFLLSPAIEVAARAAAGQQNCLSDSTASVGTGEYPGRALVSYPRFGRRRTARNVYSRGPGEMG
jgi:hypothetical protein